MPPLCMRHSGKIVAKLIVNDDIFPDGFTTTVICSDQNLNQNELQRAGQRAIESLMTETAQKGDASFTGKFRTCMVLGQK